MDMAVTIAPLVNRIGFDLWIQYIQNSPQTFFPRLRETTHRTRGKWQKLINFIDHLFLIHIWDPEFLARVVKVCRALDVNVQWIL